MMIAAEYSATGKIGVSDNQEDVFH